MVWENCLHSGNDILNNRLLASNQAGSIGWSMRTGEFWEEGSFLCMPVQTLKKEDVTCPAKKVTELCSYYR